MDVDHRPVSIDSSSSSGYSSSPCSPRTPIGSDSTLDRTRDSLRRESFQLNAIAFELGMQQLEMTAELYCLLFHWLTGLSVLQLMKTTCQEPSGSKLRRQL